MAVLLRLVDAGEPRKLLELCRPRLLDHRHDLALHQLAGEDFARPQNSRIARGRQRDGKVAMHRHGRRGPPLALFGRDLDHHCLQRPLHVRSSKARGIAKPRVSVVQDVEHQPRLGAERQARAILRHILLSPRHPAAALARGLRFAALETNGRIIIQLNVLFVDHPADLRPTGFWAPCISTRRVDRRDGPNGSLDGIARQDWEGKVVDRCNRIPEVAGWWVLCYNCRRVTDWVRVGYRSDQATTLFPIATSWRSFVGCPRRTGVQSLYGDKSTSVVEPQCFPSPAFQVVFDFDMSARDQIAT
jgi:hypothetical protein